MLDVRVWDDRVLDQLAAVTAAAAAGKPALLVVEGESGMGKTSLLDELVRRAPAFRVLVADGLESSRFPFGVLAQWGAGAPRPVSGGAVDPFVAAQSLRALIESGDARPVLLRLDDLQWADPESVEAVCWLLRRASGDRLLVAVGSRPLPAELHPGWQRWVAGRGETTRILLSGLSAADAVTLAQKRRPGTTEEVARLLWAHTSGNPLYLTALVEEYEPAEVLAMRVLPAPAEFVRLIRRRLRRLSSDAVALVRAVAVLGAGWVALLEAAAVGQVAAPAAAIDELTEGGFTRSRSLDPALPVQIVHALVRSAIYQETSPAERRALHARAAGIVVGEAVVLEHRMAAADHFDQPLADALDSYGRRLYEEGSFRLAAQYLRWSSLLTSEPRRREQQWLDSLFASLMADDFATVHRDRADIGRAGDDARRILVLGTLAIFERRRDEGIDLLTPLAASATGSTDPVTRYRIDIVLAWAQVSSGRPTKPILEGLARARRLGVTDPGLAGLALVTEGQVTTRVEGAAASLQTLADLPERATSVLLADTDRLAWRGSLRARLGLYPEALADLTETGRRVQKGVTRLGVGTFYAFLAHTQWLLGDWAAARLNLRLALDIAAVGAHPMTLAIAPLIDIGNGSLAEADTLIDRASAYLRREPWPEACQILVTSLVVRAHAEGSTRQQAALLGQLRAWGFVPPRLIWDDPLLLLHGALAAVWAGEIGLADQTVEQALTITPHSVWLEPLAHWVTGLIAEARGNGRTALDHLAAAAGGSTPTPDGLPLYRAHAATDHARLAYLLGDRVTAEASLRRAEDLYRTLGAYAFLDQVTALHTAHEVAHRPVRPSFNLTEREQDVLTLAVTGLTYAQISRELFVTHSTVSYHLSNIYAKVGVTSRHALAEIARQDPALFRLPARSG